MFFQYSPERACIWCANGLAFKKNRSGGTGQ